MQHLSYTIKETKIPDGFEITHVVQNGAAAASDAALIENVTEGGTYGFVNEKRFNVTAVKNWVDDEQWAELTRPESLTFTLQRRTSGSEWVDVTEDVDGNPLANPVTITPDADGVWPEVTWTNLPVFVPKTEETFAINALAYTYRVKEDPVNAYTSNMPTVNGLGALVDNTLKISNTLNPFQLTLSKKWVGDASYAADRPDINVELYYRSASVQTWSKWGDYTITGADGWKKTVEVPRYNDANEVLEWRVVEVGQYDGYTIELGEATTFPPSLGIAATLEVRNRLKSMSLQATKAEWLNDSNLSVIEPDPRPAEVVFTLYRRVKDTDGAWQKVGEKTATAATNWTVQWDDLPAYTGRAVRMELVYKIEEVVPQGYTVAYNGENGETPVYTASEYEGSTIVPATLATNTFELISIDAIKHWEDNNGLIAGFDIRPENVTLTLQYSTDGGSKWTDVVNAENMPVWSKNGDNWNVSWAKLPAWTGTGANRKAILYRVVEKDADVPAGYVRTYAADGTIPTSGETATFEITNTAKTFTMKVLKKWEKDTGSEYHETVRPLSIYVMPQASVDNGKTWVRLNTAGWRPMVLNAENNWTTTYPHELPLYTGDGVAILYRWAECDAQGNISVDANGTLTSVAPGYFRPAATDLTGAKITTATAQYTMSNELIRKSLTIEKVWEEDKAYSHLTRPESIDVRLYWRTEGEENSKVLTLTAEKDWKLTVSDLPVFDRDGVAFTYRVEEVLPIGYALKYLSSDAAADSTTAPEFTFTVKEAGKTDTLTNALTEVQNVTATKKWQGDTGFESDRPDDVVLTLQYRLHANDTWKTMMVNVDGTLVPDTKKAYASENWTVTWENLPKYDVDGNELQYRVVELKSDIPVGYVRTDDVVGVENALYTFDLTNELDDMAVTAYKQWVGDSSARPDVKLELWRKTADGSEEKVNKEPTVTKEGFKWTFGWTGLPTHTGTGSDRVAYTYFVKEVYPEGYTGAYRYETSYTNNAITGADGEITATNTLKPFQLVITKTWDDADHARLTRPADLAVKLWRKIPGGQPEQVTADIDGKTISFVWTKGESEWTIAVDNLPAYNADGRLYSYYVTEDEVPGYECTLKSAELNGDPYVGNMENTELGVPELALTNKVVTTEITAEKLWTLDHETHDWTGYRPESVTLTLQYSVDGGTSWENAALIVGEEAIEQTREVNTTDGTLGDKFFWDNLPTYILVTEGGKQVHKEVTYRVTELNVPTGYELLAEGETLTNALKTTELPVRKVWDDQEDYYGLRPDSVKITLLRSVNGTDWEAVTDDSGKVLTLALTAANGYEGVFECLPTVDKDGKPFTYAAEEAEEDIPAGYETSTTMGEDGETIIENTLLTIDLEGDKVWDDWENMYGVRPETIPLTVLVNGEPIAPQPVITFTGWHYEIKGLPKMVPDADGNMVEAVYTIQEGLVPGYVPDEEIVTGTVNAAETLITMTDIVNRISCKLEIDNVTANAAHPGVTNVGGFVSVGGNELNNRDIDPWMDYQVYVSWKNEENWMHTDQIVVQYMAHGDEEFTTIVVRDFTDLSALKEVFPDARMEFSRGEIITRRLILANDPSGMPYKTRVEVRFAPTIAVENTTLGDRGGKVWVRGGYTNDVYDGRYDLTTVYGEAKDGWRVDLDHLQIGGIGAVSSSVMMNWNALTIPSGGFTATLTLPLAGEDEQVSVPVSVNVLARDTYGNPTKVAITVAELPGCIDIGIPFKRAGNPAGIAQTGDPLVIALMIIALSGMGLAAITIIGKRKRKKEN